MSKQTEVEVKFLSAYKELFNKDHRYIIYYGGRSSGKSHQTALALVLRARQEPLRILCTREIQNTIRDSVHKLLVDIIEKYGFVEFEVTRDSIRNNVTGSEFLFRGLKHNIDEIKSTEGIDIAWVEEAQSMSDHSIDVLTPTIRKPGSQIIFTFNRYTELDPVFVRFVMQNPPKTYVRHVNFDVLESAGILPDVIKTEIEKDKSDPALYAHKWLGEPISQDEFSVIPRDKIMEAMNRNLSGEGSIEVGVDVARMGNDRTVFWMIHGLVSIKKEIHEKKKTVEVCDLLERFVDNDKTIVLKVDDTGVGGGVSDDMERRGYNVKRVNFGANAKDKDKYPNLISEAWFQLAENIDQVDLPFDQELLMELSTRRWKQDNKGRRRVESKDDYKKQGYRSPDVADACIIAYYRDMRQTTPRVFHQKPRGF